MHHFRAKGGTSFNFNSDLSGRVHVHSSKKFPGSEGEIDADDLLEFVDWYRHTPGYGLDEEAVAETLTAEERRCVEAIANDSRELLKDEVAKLLRLHDALQARVGELARETVEEIARLTHNTAVDESALAVAAQLLREWLDGKAPGADTQAWLRDTSHVPDRPPVDPPEPPR